MHMCNLSEPILPTALHTERFVILFAVQWETETIPIPAPPYLGLRHPGQHSRMCFHSIDGKTDSHTRHSLLLLTSWVQSAL